MTTRPHPLLALLILTSCLPVAAAQSPEMSVALTNPGFEDGTKGWDWWMSPPDSVKIGVIAEGTGHCVQFLGTAGSTVAFYQDVPVEPRSWYRLRFRYKSGPNGAGGGSFGELATRLIDPNGKHFDYPCTVALLDTFGQWQTAEKLLYAPRLGQDLATGVKPPRGGRSAARWGLRHRHRSTR